MPQGSVIGPIIFLLQRSPLPKGKWKPINAREYGYDVSVRPTDQPTTRIGYGSRVKDSVG